MSQPINSDFLQFLDRYQALVGRIARSFAFSQADRDDLVQEILISLWAAKDRIPANVKESTYVYRIALNRAISWKRKEQTFREHSARYAENSDPESADADTADQLEVLYSAIRSLPSLERSLILMFLDKCPYAEMAEVMGMNETTVGKRLSRAKLSLVKLAQSQSNLGDK